MNSKLIKLIKSLRAELVIINWGATLIGVTKYIVRTLILGIIVATLLVDIFTAVVVYGETVANLQSDPYLVIRDMISLKIMIAVPVTFLLACWDLLFGKGIPVCKWETGSVGRTILVAGIRSGRDRPGGLSHED